MYTYIYILNDHKCAYMHIANQQADTEYETMNLQLVRLNLVAFRRLMNVNLQAVLVYSTGFPENLRQNPSKTGHWLVASS